MKRTLIISALVLASLTARSQYAWDALRFSQTSYEGTARSLSMGNAMAALGGDMGAIAYNPAALGVYRYSEFVITPSVNGTQDVLSSYNYAGTLSQGGNNVGARIGLSNIGALFDFKINENYGLLNLNVAISAHQSANYFSRASTDYTLNDGSAYLSALASNYSEGYITEEEDLGWSTYALDQKVIRIDPPHDTVWSDIYGMTDMFLDDNTLAVAGPVKHAYTRNTRGYTQDVNFSVGGNVNNMFFFGLNLTLVTMSYNSTISKRESSVNVSDFPTGFDYCSYSKNIRMSGVGFKMTAGVIVRPIAGLSIGASVTTPAWTTIRENRYYDMTTSSIQHRQISSDISGSYTFKMTSPWRWTAGLGYIFGQRCSVDVDYEAAYYGQIKLTEKDGKEGIFSGDYGDNAYIKNNFKTVHSVRAGTEWLIVPGFSMRAGYNFYSRTNDLKENDRLVYNDERHFASFGLGWRSRSSIYIDAAAQVQCNTVREEFNPMYEPYCYDPLTDEYLVSAPYAVENSRAWKVLLTIGFRF
ncbi:MAG: outer membrane protein transport protein [Bacteroidales bacterium]|nr:outer membrane protein transport protein [Bacteroidales bacterium]